MKSFSVIRYPEHTLRKEKPLKHQSVIEKINAGLIVNQKHGDKHNVITIM